MSLLLVTTGATSALLVNRGLSAPTFVSLCNYIMLGAYVCDNVPVIPLVFSCVKSVSLSFARASDVALSNYSLSILHTVTFYGLSAFGGRRDRERGGSVLSMWASPGVVNSFFFYAHATNLCIRKLAVVLARARVHTDTHTQSHNEHARSRRTVLRACCAACNAYHKARKLPDAQCCARAACCAVRAAH